jgi:hypothetical protein
MNRTEQIRRTKLLSDQAATVLRRMPGAKRLAMMGELVESCRDAMVLMVRLAHPEWSDEQTRREVARRIMQLNQ